MPQFLAVRCILVTSFTVPLGIFNFALRLWCTKAQEDAKYYKLGSPKRYFDPYLLIVYILIFPSSFLDNQRNEPIRPFSELYLDKHRDTTISRWNLFN